MRERNRPKREEESWRAELTGVMEDEESSEGLTDKHERKKETENFETNKWYE